MVEVGRGGGGVIHFFATYRGGGVWFGVGKILARQVEKKGRKVVKLELM